MSRDVDLEIELQEVLINFGCVSNLENMSLDELINQLTSIRDKALEQDSKIELKVKDSTPYEDAELDIIGYRTETITEAKARIEKTNLVKSLCKKRDALGIQGKELHNAINCLIQAAQFTGEVKTILNKLIEEIKTVRRLYLETVQQLEQLNNIKRDTKMPDWQYASYGNLQKEKL